MSIFSRLRPLQAGEKIINPDGSVNSVFGILWQQLVGNPEYLNTNKADKDTILTAGAGLTGGGDLSADRTFNVGAGTGITVNADDVAIDLTAEAERIRDTMGTALVAGTNITITPNDGADTITIATTAAAYTNEDAQDAVGGILTDTSTIDFTYNDGANTITADVKAGSIGATQLVTADVQEIARDALGTALVAGSNITITPNDGADTITIAATGGSGGSWIPAVTGAEPPVLVSDGAGVLILVAGP